MGVAEHDVLKLTNMHGVIRNSHICAERKETRVVGMSIVYLQPPHNIEGVHQQIHPV